MKKTAIIGISGGIAAYKIVDLIKNLTSKDIDVKVIITKSAKFFVSSEILQKVSDNKVYSDLFQEEIQMEHILSERKVEHIELVKKADLFVIAPATANVIAKLAAGIADDYLTTAVLASKCMVVICPSMNVFMWTNPATQENVQTLKKRGYIILGPDQGMLACGYKGKGRLVDIKKLSSEIIRLIKKKVDLKAIKIIVTSGPTREYIDDVRFISNKSSGKMGIALANAAYLRGADVLLLRSKSSLSSRYNIKEILFETVEDLKVILEKNIPNFDICFQVAAVSDFKPNQKIKGKLPSESLIGLELIPVQKLLNIIKNINPAIELIGFKAAWNESDKDLIQEAKNKLSVSGADFIIANNVGQNIGGFDSDQNAVIIVGKNGKIVNIPLASKTIIAEKILDFIFYDD